MRNLHFLGILALTVTSFIASTALVSADEFTLVQMCDTQLGMGGYAHDMDSFEKAVAQINTMAPDLVVICGDLVNDPDDKSFTDFKRIHSTFTVPCYLAAGNHDVENVPTSASLAKYRETIGDDYFTVDHKGYTFVIVNTQLWKVDVPGESAKHQEWFKKTLTDLAAKNRKSVIVGHFPLFLKTSDEEEEYFNIPKELRTELLSLMVQNGVVAYMAGHVHRNLLLEYQGIPMIASASGSLNLDDSPLGFRVWKMGETGPKSHEFVEIEGLDPKLVSKKKK